MPQDKDGRSLQKHTLNLFEGDWQRLGELFPKADTSIVIRHLVRDLIKRVEGESPDVKVDVD